MHRIDTATKAVDLFGAGKHGFKAGDPSIPTPATHMSPDWCNDLQENVARVIEDLGIALVKGDGTQLKAAIQQMITNAAFGIPPLPDHMGAAADADELAIVVGGVHKRISVAELFTNRAGIDQVARDMAMVTAFQQFIANSTAAGVFADWARINTFPTDNLPTKTGATYDSTNKLYHNVTAPVQVAQGTGTNIGDMTGGGGLAALWDGNTSQANGVCANNPSATGNAGKDYTAQGGKRVAKAQVWASSDYGYYQNTGSAVTVHLQHADASGGPWTTLATNAGTDTNNQMIEVSYSGTPPLKNFWRLQIIAPNGACKASEIRLFEAGAPSNLTLIDTAYTVPSTPLDGRAFMLHKFTAGGVLNTDVKAYMARDGGAVAQWVQGTLSVQDAFVFNTGFNLLVADFDLSSLPTGTSPVLKVETFNLVEQQVRALGSIAS